MRKRVAFCQENLARGSQDVLNELKAKHSDKFDIRVSRCLAACGDCFSALIADVHGKLIVKDTPKELLLSILAEYNTGD